MVLDYSNLPTMVFLTKTYDPVLILVSIVIAIVSAFTAFGTAERAINTHSKKNKLAWIIFGAVSLGLGIWAMHFIGMLALSLPIQVSYSTGITLVSILPGIVASGAILWAMIHRFSRFKQVALSGILFAGGVTAMHLIGMFAMKMNATMHMYFPVLVLSVLTSIIFATIALQLQVKAFTVTRRRVFNINQLASAIGMGGAIASMHYMAMYATEFSAVEATLEVHGMSSSKLAIIIGISVLVVILLAFLIPTILAKQYQQIAGVLRQKFQSELSRKNAITDLAYDAWIHLNSKGEILGWNKSAEMIFGWKKHEVIDKNLAQFIIPNRHRQAHKLGLAHFLSTGEGSVLNKVLELEALHRDGRHFPLEITITAIKLDGDYEFSAFMRDISARKESESRQEKLMHELQFEKNALDAHAIVSVTNVKGEIIYANEKFEKISQYSRSELLGQNHRLLKSDYHDESFFKDMWATITSGNVWHGILKNKAKDGSDYWVASTIVPFLDDNGKPIRYVSIRTDITELKRLEERFQLAMNDLLAEKKLAERANRAKSDFLASMNHELRTPLNAIIGFAQLMESNSTDPISDSHREELGYIIDSGKHLLSLVNDVLDLAQIESGRSVVSLESIKLEDAINEAVSLVQNLAEQKQITINVLAQDHSLSVIADYTKLKQVMINLISNAIKYNKEGGHVNIDFFDYDGDMIRISVMDSGIGISKKNHHRIFSAFDRLGQETSNIEGTGVGLVVTKNIVELMCGRIDFDRQQQQGATFWVDLPAAKVEVFESDSELNSKADQALTDMDVMQDKKHILCVEDNPVNQKLMNTFLASYPQVIVCTAGSAEQAWQRLEQQSFDLILMDINLPEMDGISLTSKIRKLDEPHASTPIIAISAIAIANTLEDVGDLFEAYLTKPVDFDKLKALLQRYLN